jgi:ATP adenylyltransferase
MPEPVLPAPWRMSYIKSLESSPAERSTSGCFLCDAVAKLDDERQRRERLILWHSDRCICLLNRYPYTSGHLLIAPKLHVADLDVVDQETLLDLNVQAVRAIALLRKVLRPQGFNIGINMGSAAGAGVPGHLHQHVVPRWAGDVNFMSVVGETKVVPSTTSALWSELMAAM